MTISTSGSRNVLGRPIELPCGAVLKNRLIKSAMSDSLGDGAGNPTQDQARLYERWAEGGVALTLIGEVQIEPRYPEKPGNLVLAPGIDMPGLLTLAKRGSAHNTHIWPQLGHAGALSHEPISQPTGPSALDIEGLRCEEMLLGEIHDLPGLYARAAGLAKDAGFGGVQLHAGHGFLFSQFLSPLFNKRTDSYGGNISRRFRVIRETIDEVRLAVGADYPIGIKINSTDNLQGGLDERDALEVVKMLDPTSVDLIDVSGGTYFPGAVSSSDKKSSGPYFVEFTRRAKEITSVPVAATGGFVRRDQAREAVEKGDVDCVSLARAMALDPSLANSWLGDNSADPIFPVFNAPPGGGVTAWYSMRLTALARDCEDKFDMTPATAIETYETRDAQRCERWRKRFPPSS